MDALDGRVVQEALVSESPRFHGIEFGDRLKLPGDLLRGKNFRTRHVGRWFRYRGGWDGGEFADRRRSVAVIRLMAESCEMALSWQEGGSWRPLHIM